MAVTNNGFWIVWLDLLTPFFIIILNHNQLQQLTINDCLRLAPFWLDNDCLLLWLTWFWFTSHSLTSELRLTNHEWIVLSLSLMLRPTVSWPVCLGIKHPSGAYDLIFITVTTAAGLLMRGALPDERTGLSFTISAGPRQRSYSRVRVPWESRPYFTVSDSRLHFRRLLLLARLRWKYSSPPPHGISS
jgi:hypothetical protein